MLIVLTVAAGRASRQYASSLPTFIAEYAGDTLWAIAVYFSLRFLMPSWPLFRIAVFALVLSYTVEISQLYHAPWIDSLRHTRIGGLVLGFGFLWSDLACYTVGVATGVILDNAARKAGNR